MLVYTPPAPSDVLTVEAFFFPPPVHLGLRGLPSWLWLKCNRLLRLGLP
jgi:hypothetical protein